MNKLKRADLAFQEGKEIMRLRQLLTAFVPAEGSMEVVFQLPDGEKVTVPIHKPAKMRVISQEVRNYLAEEQLELQEKEQEIVK